MKKRNVLVTVLAMVLVAVVSVTGTLAYLTATDTKAVNTFQFAQGLEVQLTEAVPTEGLGNATAKLNGSKGVSYENVVNGQVLPKEPKIQLTKYTVDTYVFAKIDNQTKGNVTVGAIDSAWTDCGNNVYGRLVKAGEAADVATPLFSNVTISDNITSTETVQSLGEINIYVSAIQASGFETMEAALAQVTVWEK